jgi:serine/threonine protein kinase
MPSEMTVKGRSAEVEGPSCALEPWAPPATFEEYQLLGPLGRGATGQVFLAKDLILQRPVALKFLPALAERRIERFERGDAVSRR